MKKGVFLFVVLVCFSVLFSQTTGYTEKVSDAAVLVENFTATGNLNGYNSWTRYDGTADQIQITSGALTYSNYPNSGVGNKITINGSNSEDVYKSFTAITSQYVYYSFLIKVTPSNSTGAYFMFLDPDGNLASTGDWCARLFAKSDGTNIQFGISNSSTASWASTNYDNNTHCIVVKLDRNTGNLALFVDPDLSNSTEPTPTFTVNGSGAIGNVSSIAIRQAPNLPAMDISNLRVANSWSQAPLPVELSLFTYKLVDGKVKLVWNTATELNNKGFYVEKNTGNSWITLGFVDGKGNSNISNSYEFTDNSQNFGKVSYRLKQVDNDGKFTYSHTIEVNATLPKELTLMQNYPNPFNPATTISYAIPTAGNVSVKVYNSLGQEVVTLFEGYQEAGMKQLNFNANNLNSGIYYCVVNFGNSTKVTKMMLMK